MYHLWKYVKVLAKAVCVGFQVATLTSQNYVPLLTSTFTSDVPLTPPSHP